MLPSTASLLSTLLTNRSVPARNRRTALAVSLPMLESLSKQLRARRLINQRGTYRRNDDQSLSPRLRWP